jgi:hypothetical protein
MTKADDQVKWPLATRRLVILFLLHRPIHLPHLPNHPPLCPTPKITYILLANRISITRNHTYPPKTIEPSSSIFQAIMGDLEGCREQDIGEDGNYFLEDG